MGVGLDGGCGDERLALQDGGVAEEVAGGEVVGAVDEQVVGRAQLQRVGRREAGLDWRAQHLPVDVAEGAGGGGCLGEAEGALAVDDLAVEVGELEVVVVDDAEAADAHGGEVLQHGRAGAAGADDEDGGAGEALLAGEADEGEDELPAVAQEVGGLEAVGGEECRGRRGRRYGWSRRRL